MIQCRLTKCYPHDFKGVLALTINRLGMSLTSMGKDSDVVRFLDEFDLSLSLDSRSSSSQQMTNMEINAKPIVFRASYRDIMLITSIVDKAIELGATNSTSAEASTSKYKSRISEFSVSKKSSTKQTAGKPRKSVGKARAVASKEQASAYLNSWPSLIVNSL